MNKLEAKQCLYWYTENFNNAESFNDFDKTYHEGVCVQKGQNDDER